MAQQITTPLLIYSIDVTDFTCADIGPNTITLTVTDGSTNTATCTTVVTVADVTPPTAICQNISVDLDALGNASITAAQIDNGSFDECSVVTLSLDITDFTCANIGDNTVTLTVTDVSMNTSTCTATVTVNDNIAPVITCPAPISVSNDPGVCGATVVYIVPSATDNCSVGSIVQTDATGYTSGDVFPVGTTTLEYTATDGEGNTDVCTFDVTVTDSENPVASCQNITVQLDNTGNATIIADQINDGSTDNCGIDNMTIDINSFSCVDVGVPVTVTLTVEDASGNSDNCTALVTIEDNVPPTAVCQNITVSLVGGSVSVNAAQIDGGSTDACGIASLLIDGVASVTYDCTNVGDNNATLTVIDNNGNSSTCNATITVVDDEDPVAVCAPFIAELDASGMVTVTGANIDGGSSDNCGIASLDVSPNTFDCDDIATNPHTVTLTVTDNSGNTDQCTTTVTVVDNLDPVVQCISNPTFELDASGNLFLTPDDIDDGSTDNCGIQSMSLSQQLFTCADVGPVAITLTVTDVNGNSDFCVTNATIVDNTDPVAICQDITVPLDVTGNAIINGNDIDDGSSDACGVASVTASPNTFTCANVGPNTVTLTVTDVNGNTSTCTSTVTIVDNENPVAICKDITIQLDANGEVSIVADDINNGSNDNCNITLTVSQTEFDCSNVGANTVTLTVTDDSGNTASCDAIVTVEDNIAPVLDCIDINAYLDATGNVTITGSVFASVLTISGDNASGASGNTDYTVNITAGETITFNWDYSTLDAPNWDQFGYLLNGTFTQLSDNTGMNNQTGNATVTVIPGDVFGFRSQTVDNDFGPSTTKVTNFSPGFTGQFEEANWTLDLFNSDGNAYIRPYDACGIASETVVPNNFSCTDVGPNAVVLTVVDNNGNSSTCNPTVTVFDTVVPSVTCPADDEIFIGAGCQVALPDYSAQLTATDACGIASAVQNPAAGTNLTYADLGANIVEFTVTDVNGNVETCSFTVTVTDAEAFTIDNVDVTTSLAMV